MNSIIGLTEIITYILFAFLVGHVALQFVPTSKKPLIEIPKIALLMSILGTILFSLGPVFQVVFYFSESVGFAQTIVSVFTDFQVGKAWIFISFMATFLWMTIHAGGTKYLQAALLLLMVLGVGYASHVTSLDFWPGFISHTIHFLIVTLWGGILLHVAWFSKGTKNMAPFLKWFSPFAIACMVIIIVSGFVIMLYVVEVGEYVSAWGLSYGQLLLLKHISIIPIVAFAWINQRLSKRNNPIGYNAKLWLRAESFFIIIIFYFTSIMGTYSPPHDLDVTLLSEGAGPLIGLISKQEITVPLVANISFSFEGMALLTMALFFLCMIFASLYRKISAWIAVLFGVSFIIALFAGLILSIDF